MYTIHVFGLNLTQNNDSIELITAESKLCQQLRCVLPDRISLKSFQHSEEQINFPGNLDKLIKSKQNYDPAELKFQNSYFTLYLQKKYRF